MFGLAKKLFGTENDRKLKKLRPLVAKINGLEDSLIALTDDQLKLKTEEFKSRHKTGESLDDLLPEAFAVVREAAKRTLGQRHYDVQLIGGRSEEQTAIGGGGRWHGLLQILPGTARSYGCEARSGAALRNGGATLSCALRIMAVTVRRDGVVHGRGSSWQGVSADWGPMRSQSKRADIANWTRSMPACRSKRSLRPKARP